jgi:hypothetical protein
MVESPTTTRKPRGKTPKKAETKQDAMEAMFAGRLAASDDDLAATALDDVLEHVVASASESPTPSAARPVPPPKNRKA